MPDTMRKQISETYGGSRSAPGDLPTRSIAFFGYDSTESTLIKRVRAFQANNSRVIGFMFRRVRKSDGPAPTWDNVDLGVTIDRHYLRRIPKLLAAVVTALRHKSVLRQCQICYARNIDMLIVAAIARKLARSEALLVYEVLDVQRIFLGPRLVNRFARWVERILLRSCDVLVVSSPDFVDRYFVPYQRLSTPWRLLENKVPAGVRPAGGERRAGLAALACPPWVIGWFGILRCARSLNLLCGLADALGDRVQIYMRGRTSEEDLPMEVIEAATYRHPNVVFGGPYTSPGDLPALYGRVHFSWAVDYLDAGTNSDWLLPNRIYEGGLFGSLALARKDTATSRLIESKGLGWTFDEPLEVSVAEFLNKLDIGTYERARNSVASLSSSTFVDETDTRDLLEYLDALARQRPSREMTSMRSTSERPLA